MKNVSLAVLVFFLRFYVRIQATSFELSRAITPIAEEMASEVLEFEESKGLRHFRMADHWGQYYHTDLPKNNHEIIVERANLYNLLLKLSTEIEALNVAGFEQVLREMSEEISFCVRFHIIFSILDRFKRLDLDSDDYEPISLMILALSRVESSEVANNIVHDQFHDFNNKLIQVITAIKDESVSTALMVYLNSETARIPISL